MFDLPFQVMVKLGLILFCLSYTQNIWGLSLVFISPYKYFVTTIDEFSRCTWTYLMKECSELFPIFRLFYTETKIQFGQKKNIVVTIPKNIS